MKILGRGKAIDIFSTRINNRYIKPIQNLINSEENKEATNREYGFTIMAINCLLVEALESFIQGVKGSEGKSKEFFINFLTRRINFNVSFDEEEKAKVFYKHIRCSILHQAEVTGGFKIWSVGVLIDFEYKYVNRTKFFEGLKNEIGKYKNQFLNNEDNLRKNFIRKMNFIIENCKIENI